MEDASLTPAVDYETLPLILRRWAQQGRDTEGRMISLMAANPFESLLFFIIGGSVIFYNAEHRTNPKVKTFWDAICYVSTCASVGYADIFAQTPAGKMVSTVLNTFGPALCAKVLDQSPASGHRQNAQAVVEKLDAILAELRRMNEIRESLPNVPKE